MKMIKHYIAINAILLAILGFFAVAPGARADAFVSSDGNVDLCYNGRGYYVTLTEPTGRGPGMIVVTVGADVVGPGYITAPQVIGYQKVQVILSNSGGSHAWVNFGGPLASTPELLNVARLH